MSVVPFSCDLHYGHSAFLVFVSTTKIKCTCIPISRLKRRKSVLPHLCSTMSTLVHKAHASHHVGCLPARGDMLLLSASSLVESAVAGETGSHGKEQTFSNFSMHMNHQETLWECRVWFRRCGLWHDFFCFQRTPRWCQCWCSSEHTLSNKHRTQWPLCDSNYSEGGQSVWEVCGCEMAFHVKE